MWLVDRKRALALAPARAGAVEHGQVLLGEVRRAFERHGAAGVLIGGLDVLLREAEVHEQVERRVQQLVGVDAERRRQELLAERPAIEDELDVEGGLERVVELAQHRVGKALGLERGMIDGGRLGQRAVADRIGLDLGDLGLAVAERAQRLRHGLVDDLEVAAAGELLELHQREVGLDARGVAIHDQADGAGGRDHGRLGVAEAVLLAERDGLVPGALGGLDQAVVGTGGGIERHRRGGELFVAVLVAVGGAAVIADDAQHVGAVGLVAGEGPELLGHLGGRGIGDAGHDGGERAADGAALG